MIFSPVNWTDCIIDIFGFATAAFFNRIDHELTCSKIVRSIRSPRQHAARAAWPGSISDRNSLESRKSVGGPSLAADAIVHEEQPVGIVFRFHRLKPRMVLAPIGALPPRIEIIAFGYV
jgi:hypothetical protein